MSEGKGHRPFSMERLSDDEMRSRLDAMQAHMDG